MSDPYAQKTYNTLLELLTPTNRHRSSSEISDGLKRIRRLVLTEGIPELVRPLPAVLEEGLHLTSRTKKTRYDLEYGN